MFYEASLLAQLRKPAVGKGDCLVASQLPTLLFHPPSYSLSCLSILLDLRKVGRKGKVRKDNCHHPFGHDNGLNADFQRTTWRSLKTISLVPHNQSSCPFSLRTSFQLFPLMKMQAILAYFHTTVFSGFTPGSLSTLQVSSWR